MAGSYHGLMRPRTTSVGRTGSTSKTALLGGRLSHVLDLDTKEIIAHGLIGYAKGLFVYVLSLIHI